MKTLTAPRPRVLRRYIALCLLLGLAAGCPDLTPGLRAADPTVGALTLEPTTASLIVPEWLARARAINQHQRQVAHRAAAAARLMQTRDDADLLALTLAAAPLPPGSALDDAPHRAGPASDGAPIPSMPDATSGPADDATSGFVPGNAVTSGYSHAKFAADMLAAPAHAALVAEARAAWLEDSSARPAPASVPDQAPHPFAAPAWTAAPGAAFARAAYVSPGSASGARVAGLPAGSLPAALGNAQSVAYGFGNNFYGQQGSTTANSVNTGITSPTQITAVSGGVSAVAAGGSFGLILRGGSVYAAGNNFYGQLGNTTNNGNSTAPNPTPTLVSGLPSGVTAIAGGANFSLAVANGNVYAFGYNATGQLGNSTNAGTANPNPTPTQVSGVSGVTTVAAGGTFSLAVTGGNVYAWGGNNNGQLGNTTNNGSGGTLNSTPNPTPVLVSGVPNGVTMVAAGTSHSLALVNGSVYAWGYNQFGQLGNTTNNLAGSNVATPTPTRVSGLPNGVTAITAGANFSLAVANGNVFSWGFNGNGQLGNGTTSDTTVANPTPYEVQFGGTNLGGIVALAASGSSSYALATDGSLYVWGNNANGQLGLGNNTTPYTTPQHLLPPSGQFYQAIDSDGGGTFALAIVGDAPVPEPATWAGGALLVSAAGLRLRRRLRGVARG